MKALLLAAGEGTRLRPHTLDRPKPMVPVGGMPMIGYALAWLQANGVTQVAVNVHYKPEPLIAYVGNGDRFGLVVKYSHESELLGSAGAVTPLREFFADGRDFAVLYGDVLTDLPLADLARKHRARGADLTVALTTVDDPTRAGMAEQDADGWITRFVEKPAAGDVRSSWANAGVYICGPRVLDYIPTSGKSDFGRDVIPAMIAGGARVLGVTSTATVVDIGSPERWREAESLAAQGRFIAPSAMAAC